MRYSLFYTYLLTLLLVNASSLSVHAQYNNEWIDHNKSYYKFKVGADGLYRISHAVLQSQGLHNTPAEHFQLWRNGVEVPIYTSVPSGTLSSSDFIEFYGQMNDGKPDAPLYKKPEFQLADKWSLQTDTAVYFLTVNGTSANKRLLDVSNNVASNTLAPEPYFLHTLSKNFRDQINPGYAAVIGSYVYSSSYDNGEGWTSRSIQSNTPLVDQYRELFVAPVPVDAKLRFTAFGNAVNTRRLQLLVNTTLLVDTQIVNFNAVIRDVAIPSSLLGRPTDTVRFVNVAATNADRYVLGKYELTYPRTFNFGAASLFEFILPATSNGNFLEITNFNSGSTAPILYDFSEGRRYIADNAVSGKIRFALPPGGQRRFVLMNATASGVNNVAGLTKKDFIDYSLPANQGDYLIISHASLMNSNDGNPIQNYINYRSGASGGGYQTRNYDIDELVDQFAFGIKKHPASVKNFIRYALQLFSPSPKFVLLMGKGITYDQYRLNESRPVTERINIIPTFGNPGSDNILASIDNDPTPEIAIGRLSVTSGNEINDYLNKVKQHDQSLSSMNQTVQEKAWMKNVVHVIGGGDTYLQSVIDGYMNSARRIAEDTAFGAKVYTFNKLTSAAVEQVNSGLLNNLFREGIGMMTYFGHSSANTMEFNLDDPSIYDNPGKYPLFLANGCNAGNFFIYDTLRATAGKKTITENYVLIPEKGSIGFISSTHFGIVNYLNLYTNNFYTRFAKKDYYSAIGESQRDAIRDVIDVAGSEDFYNVITAEQILLGGDPAVKLYPHSSPDYAVEDPLVRISPSPLSVSNSYFEVKIKYHNLGKAATDSIRVLVKHELPDGSVEVLLDQRRLAAKHSDSLSVSVSIDPSRFKGQNKLIVSLDPDDLLSEITNANNEVVKTFFILDDEIRPAYPAAFAIVNNASIKLIASTNQFFNTPKEYLLEVDTTELFNSPLKVTQSKTSLGGAIEFTPTLQLRDSLVFYWRVAKKPDTGVVKRWSSSSFVYLSQSSEGWNQSHYFQELKSFYDGMYLPVNRMLAFDSVDNYIRVNSGLFPSFQNTISKNTNIISSVGCGLIYGSLEFILFDNITGKPLLNTKNNTGIFNSFYSSVCAAAIPYKINFSYNTIQTRNNAMSFFDSIPNSTSIVLMNWSNFLRSSNHKYINDWKNDTLVNGPGKSLYHKMMSLGLNLIDSFYRNIPFVFILKKDADGRFSVIEQKVGSGITDVLQTEFDFWSMDDHGSASTVLIGPAASWSSIHWRGYSNEAQTSDKVKHVVYGIDNNLNELILFESGRNDIDTSITFIDAKSYPYLRVTQIFEDTLFHTPWQPEYLQVKYTPVPEGALIPASTIPQVDTLEIGAPIKFSMAFKNISNQAFDSVRVIMTNTDPANNTYQLLDTLKKPILPGDTIQMNYSVDTRNISGNNSVYINFNPNNHQPEQYLFNNYTSINFNTRPDTYAPNLDVTFDGIHILNKDIVSPKPNILIKLKDDSRYLALNDTSLFSLKLRYPDGSLRSIRVDNDTLVFTPSSNVPGTDGNEASLLFRPYLTEDGEYELIVNGKDRSNNPSGAIAYRVIFEVYNKSMITNLLNYPNPFTTSTAFVFTLTGLELPTNFRIQILTVTGKIVKEISAQELGPIRIGHNITEYKWDGRDQFGQPLGNGVYLYRVLADIRGKKIDKLNSGSYNTDKFFQSGYGKMYLMR